MCKVLGTVQIPPGLTGYAAHRRSSGGQRAGRVERVPGTDDSSSLLSSSVFERSGCGSTATSNNANVIIVGAHSLTEGEKDWHVGAALNFWPFQG